MVYVVRAAQTETPFDARGTAALPLNTWTHLAVTFDNTTLRLFVNGTQVGTRAVAGPMVTSTGALRMGGNSLWGEYFQGRIDEVRVYSRALSATEIQTDMATPLGTPVADTTAPVRSNLLPTGSQPPRVRHRQHSASQPTKAPPADTAPPPASPTRGHDRSVRDVEWHGAHRIGDRPDERQQLQLLRAMPGRRRQCQLERRDHHVLGWRGHDGAGAVEPLPMGTLPVGTTQATLSVTTNESATCRYSTTAGLAYAAMTEAFATSGDGAHRIGDGPDERSSYNYYVRCQDGAGNANSSDATITFSVGADTTAPVRSNLRRRGPSQWGRRRRR